MSDNTVQKKEGVSLDAMERLAKIMNDMPTIAKMGNTEFSITALKPGKHKRALCGQSANIGHTKRQRPHIQRL